MNLLIRGILSHIWAIDPQYAHDNMPMVNDLLNGTVLAADSIKLSSVYVINASGGKVPLNKATEGSVAVIEVSGPMMKHDMLCGPVGTATISQWIKQANANKDIAGIVMVYDTPGGTVDGTEAMADTIASSKKPIVAYIDGLCASAGYWAASQSKQIIASGKTSIIGSIGVMSRVEVKSQDDAASGNVELELYATKSTHKNYQVRELNKGNTEPIIKHLDAINDVFINTVQSGRPGIQQSVLSGDIYLSTDAKRKGLIDKIGTLDDAIKAVKKLSNTTAMSKTPTTANYPNITTALGWQDGFEATEDGVYLQDAELDTIEASLAELATANADRVTLRNDAQTAATTIADLQQKLNAALESKLAIVTENATLREQVATLGGQRAHNGSTAADTGEDNAVTPPASGYVKDGTEKIGERYGMKTDGWFK